MRVIFLDFGGVTHPSAADDEVRAAAPRRRGAGQVRLDAFCWFDILPGLLAGHDDVFVVVHSNWRFSHTPEEIGDLLGNLGRRYLGCTLKGRALCPASRPGSRATRRWPTTSSSTTRPWPSATRRRPSWCCATRAPACRSRACSSRSGLARGWLNAAHLKVSCRACPSARAGKRRRRRAGWPPAARCCPRRGRPACRCA